MSLEVSEAGADGGAKENHVTRPGAGTGAFMKFTKPSWVIHHGVSSHFSIDLPLINTVNQLDVGEKETKKRLSIFSIHVHPDGSRIATGGLGMCSRRYLYCLINSLL